jgi:hypothetical protein
MLNTGHTYGTIMDIIKTGRKGKHLNTLEKYNIYRINEDNLHMNDTYIDIYNPILETLHELYIRQQHTHTPSHVIKAGLYLLYIHTTDEQHNYTCRVKNLQSKGHT